MLYYLVNADVLNYFDSLKLFELRSIFLPHIESGGSGIEIIHNSQGQDSRFPTINRAMVTSFIEFDGLF